MKPITNETGSIKHVVIDGVMRLIHPGETLMVDVPASVQTVDPPTVNAPNLAELLDSSVEKIKPFLADMNDATLNELLALELKRPSPRASLVKEIEEAQLELAAG